MPVRVEIPTTLRAFTHGAKWVDAAGATLDAVIEDLDSAYPGLRERLVDDSRLKRFVNVYRNDEDVRFIEGLATPVADGDTVTILPAVAGGTGH